MLINHPSPITHLARQMTSESAPLSSLSLASAIDSINRSFSDLCAFQEDHHFSFENSRRFSGFARRLQLFFNQLLSSLHSPLETFPASLQTSVKGISGDLSKAAEIVSIYEKSSKIFVLINCKSLCSSLQEHTVCIGGWLALLDLALQDYPELQKKSSDLCTDMKLAQFRVHFPFTRYSIFLGMPFSHITFIMFDYRSQKKKRECSVH